MTGVMTPAILVLLLRPYGFEVTLRCLIDWRQKGRLPQLVRISRGFRGGVLRCWKEKNILQRALTVCRHLRGSKRKREYGSVYRNWLSGADIPASRAQKSWMNDCKRRARIPRQAIHKCATEIAPELHLKSCTVRDTLEEICRIMLRPNYAAGNEIDISFIRTFIQHACNALGGSKYRPLIDDDLLAEFFEWVNAVFSPAGIRNQVASATAAELRSALDRYRNRWLEMGAFKQCLNSAGEPEQSFLTILANALAPLIVPFLLPNKSLDRRLAQLGAP
jgi:hypothetical protein